MRALIIYAHPHNDSPSHSSKTLELVQKQLTERKISYELIDLYAIKYNPVLDVDDFMYTRKVNTETKNFQKKILRSDIMIFIYPVWWSSMPAILKGWFDKVFTSGFAFKYVNGIPRKLLKGKRAIVFTSTGAPSFWSWLLTCNRWKGVMVKDTLGFCGIKTKAYRVGNAFDLNEKQIRKIEHNVEKAFNF